MPMVTSVLRNASSDKIFRSATQYMTKFFNHGWGDIETYQQLNRLQKIVFDKNQMKDVYHFLQTVDIKLSKGQKLNSCMTVYKGEFRSPLASLAPKMLPLESETAHFQLVIPNNWNTQKPLTIQLAGTGDHFFWRRRQFMAAPLAKDYNIASIILENPFYGYRKPKNQSRSAVNHVSDIFVMGAALMLECCTLLFWCEEQGYGPLGITGVSMGGHMATIAASGWHKPIALVPCLSWTSAGPAFTEGVLSHAVCWDVLEKQLSTNPKYNEMLRKDEAFKQMLQNHYIENALYGNDNHPPAPKSDSTAATETSALSGMYNSVTSLFSNVQLGQYFDLKGKKIGPSSLEMDLMKYLYTVPQLYNSTTKYFNFDHLKELIWPYESESKQPSKETIDYMTAIMDQATHLAHYNRPHEDSPIIFVSAEHDRYIPRECYKVTPMDVYGNHKTEVRTIDAGHVLAIIQHHEEFRDAIRDAFVKMGCTF
ncbi:protein ABHD18-like [Clytia hemisphaerica]|uniref:Protein ABHD18 n=1 Tax=Clytia hemisphaerica TaxID=252671 RepID=A0A7M5UVP3_9CNID